MIEALEQLFTSDGFIPRGRTNAWPASLMWEHLGGHGLAFMACMALPALIWRLARKRPELTPFARVFWSFSVCVSLFGLIHMLEIMAFYRPMYRLSGHLLVATGVAIWWWAWSMYRAWPLVRAMKSPAQLEHIIRERTDELAHANACLQESEARFRQIAEGLPLLVWTSQPDGSCDYLSPQWVKYTGVPQECHHGEGWIDQVHPEDRERTRSHWRSAVQRHGVYNVDYRLRGTDGTYRWFRASGLPLYNAQGAILKWFGSSIDVHDERLQAEALRESEDRQRRALATARLGHWEWDLRTGRIEHQDASQTLYGRDEDAPFQTIADYLEVVHPEDREFLKWAARKTIASGTPFELDYRVVWGDGSVHWIASRGGDIRDACGNAIRIVGVNLDITRKKLDETQIRLLYETLERRVTERTAELATANASLKLANAAAMAAARAKGDFLASMSHEIRTPMNGVVGMADLLADTPLSDNQRGYVTLIQSSAEALLTLLDDILDLSKIEAGKLSLNLAAFPLRDLCDEVTRLVAVQSAGRPLSVTCQVDPQIPPRLIGDAIRIRQVLINLMGNAVKFTEQGEVALEVSLRQRTDSRAALTLAVRDTGVGIPPAQQAIIFESFTQAEGTSSPRRGGTGLGLSISRRLTDLMGGKITVDSTPGLGSTFRVELDLEISTLELQSSAPSPGASGAQPPFDTPWRILLADDHEVNRLVACEILRKLGCQVDLATNGQEVLSAIELARYDIVLMDVQMPVMDGLAATREIRRRESALGRHTPVIALTANAMRGDQEQCLNAGMDGYLAKPVRAHLLRDTLERWCRPAANPDLPDDEPPDEFAMFDTELLSDCCGGEPRIVAEVLNSFLRSAPENLHAILAAVENGDAPDLERAAHRFKGACQTLGAQSMVASCADLVAMARRDDLAASRSVYQDLHRRWDCFRPEAMAYRDAIRLDMATATASSHPRHA